ncbi:MAG: hypothetical protein ACLT0Y_07770 [Christensenellales bacterium]
MFQRTAWVPGKSLCQSAWPALPGRESCRRGGRAGLVGSGGDNVGVGTGDVQPGATRPAM